MYLLITIKLYLSNSTKLYKPKNIYSCLYQIMILFVFCVACESVTRANEYKINETIKPIPAKPFTCHTTQFPLLKTPHSHFLLPIRDYYTFMIALNYIQVQCETRSTLLRFIIIIHAKPECSLIKRKVKSNPLQPHFFYIGLKKLIYCDVRSLVANCSILYNVKKSLFKIIPELKYFNVFNII